jgi:sugar phosphate isomerase/epimerase
MTYSVGLFLHVTASSRDEWEEEIRFIHSLNGVGHIEVWMERPEIVLSEVVWLKEKCSPSRIIVHAPFLDISLVSHHEEIRKAGVRVLKRCLHASRLIGAELITIHAGTCSFVSLPDVRAWFADGYRELMDSAADKLTVCLENVPPGNALQQNYPVSLDELERLKELIPDIRFTLDIGHCIRSGNDYRPFLLNRAGSLGNIHLHNASRGGADHLGLQRPGDLDLPELLLLLRRINYTGFLSLEVLTREDIRESWNLLREAIHASRQEPL